jgi:DNA ligase-associated metallophosphoesterase
VRERPTDSLAIDLCGERVLLHADRALVWPRHRLAVVADLHFGKDDAFRRAGIALPAGAAATDLSRLDALARSQDLARLVVLGDFFHAAPRAEDAFFADFAAFRAAHAALAIDVIAGNHDRHGGSRELRDAVRWHAEALELAPFSLRHEPVAVPGRYVLAGHLHPVHVLAGPGGDRARLPVFWLRPDHAVLPAFGSLTGGWRVAPEPGDRLYAGIGTRVVELPARGLRA